MNSTINNADVEIKYKDENGDIRVISAKDIQVQVDTQFTRQDILDGGQLMKISDIVIIPPVTDVYISSNKWEWK